MRGRWTGAAPAGEAWIRCCTRGRQRTATSTRDRPYPRQPTSPRGTLSNTIPGLLRDGHQRDPRREAGTGCPGGFRAEDAGQEVVDGRGGNTEVQVPQRPEALAR